MFASQNLAHEREGRIQTQRNVKSSLKQKKRKVWLPGEGRKDVSKPKIEKRKEK